MRTVTAALLVIVGGCASTPPVLPAKIEPPSARLMETPSPLPPLKAGDDLLEKDAETRAAYGRVSGRLKSLQGYVRKIRKEKAP